MADELSARWQRVLDSLLEGRHAPVTPQPTPEHDYFSCPHKGCQRCADYCEGYAEAALEAREWKLGEHEPDCNCPPCETVREVIRSRASCG